jgi:hypothetical protein
MFSPALPPSSPQPHTKNCPPPLPCLPPAASVVSSAHSFTSAASAGEAATDELSAARAALRRLRGQVRLARLLSKHGGAGAVPDVAAFDAPAAAGAVTKLLARTERWVVVASGCCGLPLVWLHWGSPWSGCTGAGCSLHAPLAPALAGCCAGGCHLDMPVQRLRPLRRCPAPGLLPSRLPTMPPPPPPPQVMHQLDRRPVVRPVDRPVRLQCPGCPARPGPAAAAGQLLRHPAACGALQPRPPAAAVADSAAGGGDARAPRLPT